MKKRLIVYAVLTLMVLGIFDWLHVSGREIKHAKDISPDCTVTVTVFGETPTTGIGTGGYQEQEVHTLSPVQIEALRELLLSSSFRRSPADTMVWKSEKKECRYDIFVDFGDGERTISIHAAGNHHLNITDQFGGNFLMIGKNADFEKQLIHVYRSTIR